MRTILPFLLLASVLPAQLNTRLEPHTVSDFEAFVKKIDAEMDQRSAGKLPFLVLDEHPGMKAKVDAGEFAIFPLVSAEEVTNGIVNDWVGAMFLPNVKIDVALTMLRDANNHKNVYADVLDSKLLERDGNHQRTFLRIKKEKLMTVVIDTEYDVNYTPISPTRWQGRSVSTKIAEVADVGSRKEHELPIGTGKGFLWRMLTFWSLEQTPKGLYMQCRSVTLSRDAPPGLGWLVKPIVRDVPRESLLSVLASTKRELLK